MHGQLKQARCEVSQEVMPWHDALSLQSVCPCCQRQGVLRPHIVWFGEMPLYMDAIYSQLQECSLFISIGTSGNVYPAAGFVHEVRSVGRAHTVELNMEPSSGGSLFHEKIYGPATQVVPAYVQRILAGDVI
jgi:NAD-dependent deacetylase